MGHGDSVWGSGDIFNGHRSLMFLYLDLPSFGFFSISYGVFFGGDMFLSFFSCVLGMLRAGI